MRPMWFVLMVLGSVSALGRLAFPTPTVGSLSMVQQPHQFPKVPIPSAAISRIAGWLTPDGILGRTTHQR